MEDFTNSFTNVNYLVKFLFRLDYEKNLLILLLDNRNKAISHENIEDYVYKRETKSSDAIRSLIKRLRKKLSKNLILNSIDSGYFIR